MSDPYANFKTGNPLQRALYRYITLHQQVWGFDARAAREAARRAEWDRIKWAYAVPRRPSIIQRPERLYVWDKYPALQRMVDRKRDDLRLERMLGASELLTPAARHAEMALRNSKPLRKLIDDVNSSKLVRAVSLASSSPTLKALSQVISLAGLLRPQGQAQNAPFPSPDLSLQTNEWVIRHGPNGLDYYPLYIDVRSETYDAYIEAGAFGPGTGLIELQAHHFERGWAEVPVPEDATEVAYWWQHYALNQRWAQAAAFQKTDTVVPDPQASIDAQIAALFPARTVALPELYPLVVPDRLPVPGYIGKRHNTPSVAKALDLLANPLLANAHSEPSLGYSSSVIDQTALDPAPGRKPAPAPAPDGGGVMPPVIRPHVPAPPGKRTKETKGRDGYDNPVLLAMGVASEGMEVIDALHEALPASAKARSYYNGKAIQPSAEKRIAAVYKNLHLVSWPKFAAAMAKNQAEDIFYGKASQAHKELRKKALGGKSVYINPAPSWGPRVPQP